MSNKVLVALDFSEFSHAVLEMGIKVAKALKGKVFLLHIEDDIYRIRQSHEITPMDEEFFPVINQFHDARIKQCQTHMEKLYKKIPSALRGDKVIVEGHPIEEIVKYAEQNKISVLVVGAQGSSNLSMSKLGSTAEKIVRKAPCSVVVVK